MLDTIELLIIQTTLSMAERDRYKSEINHVMEAYHIGRIDMGLRILMTLTSSMSSDQRFEYDKIS